MLRAWEQLQRIQRHRAHLAEHPIAQLIAFTANLNRDPSKAREPFTLDQFLLFKDRSQEHDPVVLDPDVATVAMALRHENRCPSLLLAVWDRVIAALRDGTSTPSIRAFRSDDDAVWVIAPRWEGHNIRGGLVLVRGKDPGIVTIRDIDRSLITHRVKVPDRGGFGWVEARCLLVVAPTLVS